MQLKEYIGLDLGTKYTGIARGTNLAKIAQPLSSLKTDELIENLKKIIDDMAANAVVIGLPRNLSGDDTQQTKWVRQWVKESKAAIGLPIYWQDEALTSVKSEGLKTTTKVDEHSLAAAMILQDFLDSNDDQRVLA